MQHEAWMVDHTTGSQGKKLVSFESWAVQWTAFGMQHKKAIMKMSSVWAMMQ
jgi:hypothetical protein